MAERGVVTFVWHRTAGYAATTTPEKAALRMQREFEADEVATITWFNEIQADAPPWARAMHYAMLLGQIQTELNECYDENGDLYAYSVIEEHIEKARKLAWEAAQG